MPPRPAAPASYVAASVLAFWAGIIVAAWRGPVNFQRGLSAFAVMADTIVPYLLGLVASALLLARYAQLASPPRRRRLVGLVATLMLVVALIPADARPIPGALHTVVGSSLFVTQLILAWHLARGPGASPAVVMALGVQCVAAGMTLLSLTHVVPYMFVSQVISQAAFGGVLIAGTRTAP
jgi:hypothetical protein